jgi:CheY-like chemotaxis protein
MRVLIVEDQEEWVDAITRVAEKLSPRPLLTFAGSRDAARALVDEEFFDLIVLDLKIPTSDGALDEDPSHGFAAFTFARERAPGTPILVLTGSQAEDFVSDLLSAAQKVDIWGSKTPVGTVALIKKLNVAALPLALDARGRAVAARRSTLRSLAARRTVGRPSPAAQDHKRPRRIAYGRGGQARQHLGDPRGKRPL